MKILRNPISFTPLPVTIITSAVYIALIVSLLVVHHVVPEAPRDLVGTNLTEAWLDLQTLSDGFHPYNSHRNDHIRDWLLRRIVSIVSANGVSLPNFNGSHDHASNPIKGSAVVLISDMASNASFSEGGRDGTPGLSVYFEGTNIIVYLRGSEDEPGSWFLKDRKPKGKGGVLVNAHYDSVSTGLGTTDDGVGVITIMQLIKYFTSDGRQPKKGIIALLNNGEEDFLNGAWAFAEHPISKFPNTFLNLEGAGAGGRATLFRSTDTEVTRAYQKSKYSFGSVVSGDAFQRGIIRSATDYEVFKNTLGMRGLDVAFMEPRTRYHTRQDDTRHSSRASLHHMLSGAIATMEGLTSDLSSTFDGTNSHGKAIIGAGSSAVWFDLFGQAFAVFRLKTLFALSVTLLVVAPLTLIAIGAILYKLDKFYLFSSSKHHHHPEGDDSVAIQGWRGISRYPIAFVLATAAIIGLAFLTTTVNPYILVSSPYSVWSMMISAWICVMWGYLRTADSIRPTAFHRAYALCWMFSAGWLVLVATTVLERNPKIAGGYLLVFYFACIFLATAISWLELFGLPKKSAYADEIEGAAPNQNPIARFRPGSESSARLLAPSTEEQPEDDGAEHIIENDNDEATESTSLLGDRQRRTTFKRYSSPHQPGPTADLIPQSKTNRLIYGTEQPWSHALPSSLWLLEFLFLAPFPLIILGQVSLLLTSATFQTPNDGNKPLPIYLLTAILTVLLFAPLGPFLHRYTYHIPLFLSLVFAGTTIYNLTAFPFSPANRSKPYFLQRVDLDTGINTVSLTGIDNGPYLHDAITFLPSAAGKSISCAPSVLRRDLTECSWPGLPPRVVPTIHPHIPPETGYRTWLTFNATRAPSNATAARFHISGRNTRACKLVFNRPINDFSVEGAGNDRRFPKTSQYGSRELRLWSRTWNRGWDVSVSWDAGEEDDGRGMDGRVVCMWSDANERGVIPALDEVWRFVPDWVAVTKNQDGLVEGSKAFMV